MIFFFTVYMCITLTGALYTFAASFLLKAIVSFLCPKIIDSVLLLYTFALHIKQLFLHVPVAYI